MSRGATASKQKGKQSGGTACCEREVGALVVIVVRCIAASRAAGTVYELINQSINFSQDP